LRHTLPTSEKQVAITRDVIDPMYCRWNIAVTGYQLSNDS
jgi:hypothetical protein